MSHAGTKSSMRSTKPTTTEEGEGEGSTRWSALRRLPLWGIGITILLLLGALASAPAVRDAVTGESVSEAALSFSPAYLALSPVFDTLDALMLLSARDHVAVLVWVIGLFAACPDRFHAISTRSSRRISLAFATSCSSFFASRA